MAAIRSPAFRQQRESTAATRATVHTRYAPLSTCLGRQSRPPRCHVVNAAEITLLICTYNNAAVLRRTFESIAAQRLDPAVAWEVLVVDNNCTDDTGDVVRQFQGDPRMPPTRMLRETRQGVGYARKTGLANSEAPLVGFIDDDCLLDDGWVAAALDFAERHPRAGAVGSRVELLWEAEPPFYCDEFGDSLARQQFGDHPLRLPASGRRIPCGAGLLVRREAVQASGYLQRGILHGRDPLRLGAGEDAEIGFFVRNAGYEVWLNPAMLVRHYIPRWRTELPYLRRLHRGFGRAESHLRLLSMQRAPTWVSRAREVVNALRELRRVAARYRVVYRADPRARPSLAIGLSHALGYLQGALLRFLIGHRR